MAHMFATTAVWLSFILNARFTSAAFWTVTSNYEIVPTTSAYTYQASLDYFTSSATRTIKPKVTPTGSVVSSTTRVQSYDDIKYVSLFYGPNAVKDEDLLPTSTLRTTSSATSTTFYMDVTYTAPTSCATQFTVTTSESVSIPSAVVDQITPTRIRTSLSYVYATPYVEWVLPSGAAPFNSMTEYNYLAYVQHCRKPDATISGSGSDSSSGTDDVDTQYCYKYAGCTSLKTWIIIIVTIVPSLFLLGFVENWFWFRRLMTGRGCLRLGTISWVLISLWVTCFTCKQDGRSKEDQKLLRAQWNSMSGRQAFRLWLKWGFRHSYPTQILGPYSRTTVGIVPDPDASAQFGPGSDESKMQPTEPSTPPAAYVSQENPAVAPPTQAHHTPPEYSPGKV